MSASRCPIPPSDPVQANRVATYSGDAALIAGAPTSGATTGQGLVPRGAAQAANTFGLLIPLSAVALTAIATPDRRLGRHARSRSDCAGQPHHHSAGHDHGASHLAGEGDRGRGKRRDHGRHCARQPGRGPDPVGDREPAGLVVRPQRAAHASFPPAVTELIPSTTRRRAAASMALTINGHGFNAGSTVTIAAVGQTVVFLSRSQLSVPACAQAVDRGHERRDRDHGRGRGPDCDVDVCVMARLSPLLLPAASR